MRISVSGSQSFLDKPLLDWSDMQIAEFGSVYAECYAITTTPYGVRPNPQNPNVQMFTQKRVGELRIVVEDARSALRAQQLAAEARKRQAQEDERAATELAARKRNEEDAFLADRARADEEKSARMKVEHEQAEAQRIKRSEAAKAHAAKVQEMAAELEKQAAKEAEALAEQRKLTEAATARRRAAEQELARLRAAADDDRRAAEEDVPPQRGAEAVVTDTLVIGRVRSLHVRPSNEPVQRVRE